MAAPCCDHVSYGHLTEDLEERYSHDSSTEDEADDDYPSDDADDDVMCCSAPTICLFCEKIFVEGLEVLRHCELDHQIPFASYLSQYSVDFFVYMKMINYIRQHKPEASSFSLLSGTFAALGEEYLIPHDCEDPLLQIDFDGYQADLRSSSKPASDSITLPFTEYTDLVQKAAQADQLRRQLDDSVELLRARLTDFRLAAQILLENQSPGGGAETGKGKIEMLTESEDDIYIGSYSHFSIHLEMLQDTVRTASYKDAILKNPFAFKDKTVLDVGCGTGILSMFAAQAGARKVYGVDMSDIVYQAMDIVRENNLEDKVVIIKGKVEDVLLPVDEVDVIVSEWMGYFLLFESMLDSVIFARNRWLKKDGLVLPNRCNLLLCASDDAAVYNSRVGFWDNVYGFKMTCIKQDVIQDAAVKAVNALGIVSEACVLKSVDCCRCQVSDLDFVSPFILMINKTTTIYALVGYFDAYFDEDPIKAKVSFSTSPHSKHTHWKQTVFLLPKPLAVTDGDELKGELMCRKNPRDPRSLRIRISLGSAEYKYTMI